MSEPPVGPGQPGDPNAEPLTPGEPTDADVPAPAPQPADMTPEPEPEPEPAEPPAGSPPRRRPQGGFGDVP